MPLPAAAHDVLASRATDLSVTVYRAPTGHTGSLALDGLGGFALVSETRTIAIPAGESRIRFQGVADGIDAASAILTGLPSGLIEKNRDARVLSPARLLAATLGRDVELVRTDRKTGTTTHLTGTLRSDADGVVFQSVAGVEALRCSGLPEDFAFDPATDATATPTLSALVRSPKPLTATVRLSYLARGFDWTASYVANIAPDGKTMDLGGWVTLANSNAVSFPAARTQVVAGRVNRKSGAVEPVDPGAAILAKCWPSGSTSDTPEVPNIERAEPVWDRARYLVPVSAADADIVIVAHRLNEAVQSYPVAAAAMPAMEPLQSAAAKLVKAEALGDLKLYRVPDRTSVTSRQIKQVRLLDRHAIPVEHLYTASIWAGEDFESEPLRQILRTRNDRAHHLGLPLPSGELNAFAESGAAPLLVGETAFGDMSLDQEVEIELGYSAAVRVGVTEQLLGFDLGNLKELPLIPGAVHQLAAIRSFVNQIGITNALKEPVTVEIDLNLRPGDHLVRANAVTVTHNDKPAFRVTVPAGQGVSISYQTEHASIQPAPAG
jgi:hypothetical protein